MKFVKLHQDGREILVNLSTVSEIYPAYGSNKSDLYLGFAINGEQVSFKVDESVDEILYLSKQASEDIPYPEGCNLCNVATGCDGSC